MYSQTFSLDELSRRCDLASYILSYWQMQFPQLRNADGSLKSAFTINDEALVMRIKKLLYVDHLTIEDARERLLEERAFPVTSLRPTGVLNSQPTRTETPFSPRRHRLRLLLPRRPRRHRARQKLRPSFRRICAISCRMPRAAR